MCQNNANLSPAVKEMLNDDGTLPSHAFPGGYPLFYMDEQDEVYCSVCAGEHDDWRSPIHLVEINHEDENLHCSKCNGKIESAYGDDEDENV